jgi:hypothetical protein
MPHITHDDDAHTHALLKCAYTRCPIDRLHSLPLGHTRTTVNSTRSHDRPSAAVPWHLTDRHCHTHDAAVQSKAMRAIPSPSPLRPPLAPPTPGALACRGRGGGRPMLRRVDRRGSERIERENATRQPLPTHGGQGRRVGREVTESPAVGGWYVHACAGTGARARSDVADPGRRAVGLRVAFTPTDAHLLRLCVCARVQCGRSRPCWSRRC